MFLSFLFYKCKVAVNTGMRCQSRGRGIDICSLHRCRMAKCKQERQGITTWCIYRWSPFPSNRPPYSSPWPSNPTYPILLLPDTCTSPQCPTPITTPGKKYCSKHQCYEQECQYPQRPGSEYCDHVHGCAVIGCANRRAGFASYCLHHKCKACDAEACGPEFEYCRVNQHSLHGHGFAEVAGEQRQVPGRDGIGAQGEVEMEGRDTPELEGRH